MRLSDDNFAVIDCLVFSQAEGCRTTRLFTALPPQVTLQDEIDGRPSWSSELRDYVADLPPAYTEHVVTQRDATVKPIPLALYFDGVQFATRNSILGFWIVNLVSQRRHLVASLRKGSLCRCGCQGWCSLWLIWIFYLGLSMLYHKAAILLADVIVMSFVHQK